MTEEQSRRKVSHVPSLLVNSDPSESYTCFYVSKRCCNLSEITHLGNNPQALLKASGQRLKGTLTINRSRLPSTMVPAEVIHEQVQSSASEMFPSQKKNLNLMIKSPDLTPLRISKTRGIMLKKTS